MRVLVSACLLGRNCKYNGGNNRCPRVESFVADKQVVEICPEMMAGLGTPRTPIEIVNGVLVDKNGRNVDAALRDAAARALELAEKEQIDLAILQSRSPTCGVNQVYDGTFSGKLVSGAGVLTQALKDAGYTVIDNEELEKENHA